MAGLLSAELSVTRLWGFVVCVVVVMGWCVWLRVVLRLLWWGMLVEAYPVSVLVELWSSGRQAHLPQGCWCVQGGVCGSVESLARVVGVSHSTMHRRLSSGWLSAVEADLWACRIGVLPQVVWPGWGRVLVEVEGTVWD